MIRVAPSLRDRSDQELTRLIRDGRAYINGDTIVPVVEGAGDWPLQQMSRVEFTPDVANPFTGKLVTAGVTPHLMGPYVAFNNAPMDCAGILLHFRNHSSTSDYLVDVAFGAAGSEVVVIESLYVTCGSSSKGRSFYFPLYVPANTRVSVRNQNASGSATLAANITYLGESFQGSPSVQRIITYGADRTTSSGTAQAAPTANAWGAYTVITKVGGTIDEHNWIMAVVGDQDLTTRTAQSHVLDTAIGASGSERRLLPPFFFFASSTALQMQYFPGWWMNIARGSVLSCRYSAVGATNLGADVVIYAGCE